jgi:hypothetical protein
MLRAQPDLIDLGAQQQGCEGGSQQQQQQAALTKYINASKIYVCFKREKKSS